MSIERLSGARKAAMLFVLIGDDASSEVFKQMNEEEVTQISKEISTLRNVPPETADELLEDFHNMSLAKEYLAVGGIEYAKKLLMKSLGPESARKILDRLVKSLESTPSFSNLEKANPQPTEPLHPERAPADDRPRACPTSTRLRPPSC